MKGTPDRHTAAQALPAVLAHPDRLVLVSHTLCPYVQRVVIALSEKGVDFDRIDIDLAHKPAWFLALSPLGKTPVLLVPQGDGRVPVFESAVICDYLDETLDPALHPADPLLRAQHRAWIEVASATLNEIARLYSARDEPTFDAARAALTRRMGQIDAALGEGPWFSGAVFSLVDAAFAPVFRYFDVFDSHWPGRFFAQAPRTAAWRAALAQRSSVRRAVADDYAVRLVGHVERQAGVLAARFREAARGQPMSAGSIAA